MDRLTVDSTSIAEVGYDVDTETMEVKFKFGTVYQYKNVPQNVFRSLLTAESVGSYFTEQVKGTYEHQQILS
jgi:hypothetical protein